MSDKKNPKLWREMQEPHESAEAVNAAVDAFLDDVGKAREKHRIADVLTCATLRYVDETGEEVEAMLSHHYGDFTHAEGLAAYSYGRIAQQRQEMIAKLSSGKAVKIPEHRK
jgi:hypothetical protein